MVTDISIYAAYPIWLYLCAVLTHRHMPVRATLHAAHKQRKTISFLCTF